MHAKAAAIVVCGGRAAFGMALIAAPRRIARGWIGDDVERAPVEMLVRAIGVRDLVVGAGGLLAAAAGRPVRPWLRGGAAADAGDALLTLAYFSKLPRAGAVAALAIAMAWGYVGVRTAAGSENETAP